MGERIIDLDGAIEFEYSGKLGREMFRGRAALSEAQLGHFFHDRRILLSFLTSDKDPFASHQRRRWLTRVTNDGFRVAIWAEHPLWFGLWRQALILAEVSENTGMVFYERAEALEWLLPAFNWPHESSGG